MQDDTVLCADCVDELCDERGPETAATMIYAWLPEGNDAACRCCGATP